jgi:hypothetical protein
MASYAKVKVAVIDVVDDFTKKDVAANYKPLGSGAYSAKTKLASLLINDTVLATMTIRYNKVLEAVCSPKWTNVGAVDLVQKGTIGDLILLACAKSNTTVPFGEPT